MNLQLEGNLHLGEFRQIQILYALEVTGNVARSFEYIVHPWIATGVDVSESRMSTSSKVRKHPHMLSWESLGKQAPALLLVVSPT